MPHHKSSQSRDRYQDSIEHYKTSLSRLGRYGLTKTTRLTMMFTVTVTIGENTKNFPVRADIDLLDPTCTPMITVETGEA